MAWPDHINLGNQDGSLKYSKNSMMVWTNYYDSVDWPNEMPIEKDEKKEVVKASNRVANIDDNIIRF